MKKIIRSCLILVTICYTHVTLDSLLERCFKRVRLGLRTRSKWFWIHLSWLTYKIFTKLLFKKVILYYYSTSTVYKFFWHKILLLTRILRPYYFVLASRMHVSRTQQDRQKEPSLNIFRSSFSVEFWRHCVLSGVTQRRALLWH